MGTKFCAPYSASTRHCLKNHGHHNNHIKISGSDKSIERDWLSESEFTEFNGKLLRS
jgi:hypothetical protein